MEDKEKLNSSKKKFYITLILLIVSLIMWIPAFILCLEINTGVPVIMYAVLQIVIIIIHSKNSKALQQIEKTVMKQIWHEIENFEEAKDEIRSSGVRRNFANHFINTYPNSIEYLMSRTNGLRTINAEKYVDSEFTEEILTAISKNEKIELNSDYSNLKKAHIAYNKLLNSEVISYQNKLFATNDNELDASVVQAKGVSSKLSPIVMKYYYNSRIAFSFHIYPHRVLVYIENLSTSTFVAAYYTDVLKLGYTEYLFHTEPVVINEKSKESVEYYNKFCPISDSEIVESHWKVTNKDGSRSFRGRLSPENNPLFFTLKFGTLSINAGDFHGETTFSRYDSVAEFVDLINNMTKQYKIG